MRLSPRTTLPFLIALGCSAALAGVVFAQGGETVQTVKVSSMAGMEAVLASFSGGLRIASAILGLVLIGLGAQKQKQQQSKVEWSRKLFSAGLTVFLAGLGGSIWAFTNADVASATRLNTLCIASISTAIGLIIAVAAFKGAARLIAFGALCLIIGFDFAAAIDWLVLNSRSLNLS